MSAYTTPTAEELRAGMATLPQELKDQIYNEVVAYDTSRESPYLMTFRRITSTYKPPVQLQINRQIRADYEKEYYPHSSFYFSDHVEYRTLCIKTNQLKLDWRPFLPTEWWLRTLTESTLRLIKDVREETVSAGGSWYYPQLRAPGQGYVKVNYAPDKALLFGYPEEKHTKELLAERKLCGKAALQRNKELQRKKLRW